MCVPKIRFRLKLEKLVYLKSGSALSSALNACAIKKNIGRFPGGGPGNQNLARTIAHSPPGIKETLNYWLREKLFGTPMISWNSVELDGIPLNSMEFQRIAWNPNCMEFHEIPWIRDIP